MEPDISTLGLQVAHRVHAGLLQAHQPAKRPILHCGASEASSGLLLRNLNKLPDSGYIVNNVVSESR